MVAIPKKRDTELTGRVRVRPGWRSRLVLQVEVKTTIYSACPAMPGRDVNQWRAQMRAEGECFLGWRDAAWDDMHALSRFDLVPAGAIEPSAPWPRRGVGIEKAARGVQAAQGAVRVCPVRDAACVEVAALQQCTDCPERSAPGVSATDGQTFFGQPPTKSPDA
jgi:hypothetical protein